VTSGNISVEVNGTIPTEIEAGPQAIRDTLRDALAAARESAGSLLGRNVRRVWVLGNGTSYHSSLAAARLYSRHAGPGDPVVMPVTAGEFRHRRPTLDANDAVVGVSASGEFRDVLAVFEELRGQVPTVAVAYVPGSSATRLADHVILSSGGESHVPVMTKTFSSTLTALYLLVLELLGSERATPVEAAITRAADHAESAIAAARDLVGPLAERLATVEHLFVVAGGGAYPAALEAALKFKEMALIHAEASESWEMASGPATLVGPHTTVLALAPFGPAHDATVEVAKHCAAWGAPVIEVAAERLVAGSTLLPLSAQAEEDLAALTAVPPVALLAYALAGMRGATPDTPSWTERYRSQGLTHILGS
jgi:glutamine---fructose-6-phosphate transaminase (isomerizing)